MLLIQEDLARAHMAERLAEAEMQRLVIAAKAQRKADRAAIRAERAARRARRLLAIAVLR